MNEEDRTALVDVLATLQAQIEELKTQQRRTRRTLDLLLGRKIDFPNDGGWFYLKARETDYCLVMEAKSDGYAMSSGLGADSILGAVQEAVFALETEPRPRRSPHPFTEHLAALRALVNELSDDEELSNKEDI